MVNTENVKEWRQIEGTKNLYISIDGQVYNKKTRRFVGCRAAKGYLQVRILKKNADGSTTKGTREYIHRLMWQTWVGPIPEGYEVEHLDSEPLKNNALSNLRAVPHKVNCMNQITRQRISAGLKRYWARKHAEESRKIQ